MPSIQLLYQPSDELKVPLSRGHRVDRAAARRRPMHGISGRPFGREAIRFWGPEDKSSGTELAGIN